MRTSSLRTRLLLFIGISFLPVLLLILWNGEEQRALAAESARTDALRLTDVIASYQREQIESSRQLLIALSQLAVVRNHQTALCNPLFANMLTQYDNYLNIAVVNLDGQITCSGVAEAMEFNYADQQWFKDLVANKAFTIGDYRVGRVFNRPVLPLNYPIMDEEGNVIGAVSVVLSLQWLSEFIANVDLPPDTTVTVIDRNSTILVRYPNPDEFLGGVFPDHPASRAAFANAEGTIAAEGTDGQKRLYGYATFAPAEANAHVIIGLAENVAFSKVNSLQTRNLMALGLMSLFVVGIALSGSEIVTRPVREFVSVAHRLAAGELDQRVRVDSSVTEINDLAITFNDMAASVEQRVLERTNALLELNEKLHREVIEREQLARELQKYADRLQESNTDLQHFAYTASHDLQEPLRKVMSFSDRLRMKYKETLGADGLDSIERMQSATRRMHNLIDSLLQYSRISTQDSPREQVDLNAILAGVISDLEATIQQTGGQVKVEPLPPVSADPLHMRQLFQNLISNALKYHRPDVPPLVKISACPVGHHLEIRIEDNGIGFEGKFKERIFSLFERLHNRRQYEGTGIGLAVCRKIVDRHGGKITAESVLGQGSTFIVSLPMETIPMPKPEMA